MKITLRLTENQHKGMLVDLRRQHPTAFERVGFVSVRLGTVSLEEKIILMTDYWPVPDEHYVADDMVGARINSTVINAVMQKILDQQVGIFHVHLHDFLGKPGFSRIDIRGIFPLIPSFRVVGPTQPHGILLLSSNNAIAHVYLPSHDEVFEAKISIVGRQLKFYA